MTPETEQAVERLRLDAADMAERDAGMLGVSRRTRRLNDMAADLRLILTALAHSEAEARELKSSVVAFCAPHAARYAEDFGLPPGHLHPTHYDLLERCGARMADFTRATNKTEE